MLPKRREKPLVGRSNSAFAWAVSGYFPYTLLVHLRVTYCILYSAKLIVSAYPVSASLYLFSQKMSRKRAHPQDEEVAKIILRNFFTIISNFSPIQTMVIL